MVRPLRLSFEDAVYHITARGNRKEKIFFENNDRRVFIDKVNETLEKYSIICYAYCLMDNHYHLFIKTPLANISEGMHYLNASYTNWFKARHQIVGVVFQGRYKSIVVDEDNYSIALSTYIHLNPLRSGVVDDPKKYPWSSYLDYIGQRNSIERLDTTFILRQFDNDPGLAQKKYERFVHENSLMDNPFKDSYNGIALGTEGFIDTIKERINSFGRKREITETKSANVYTPEEIIQQVINDLSVKREDIFSKRRGNWYRQMTLYLLKRYTGLSLREIGNMFQMDYAAVSQACRRYEEKGLQKGEINL
jgi:REP element-mobilizing transposase RayT